MMNTINRRSFSFPKKDTTEKIVKEMKVGNIVQLTGKDWGSKWANPEFKDRRGVVIKMNKNDVEKCTVLWDGNTTGCWEWINNLNVIGFKKEIKITYQKLHKKIIKAFGKDSQEEKLYNKLHVSKNEYKRQVKKMSDAMLKKTIC